MGRNEGKYHHGDRVVLLTDYPDGKESLLIGATGTVVRDQVRGHDWVAVSWDNFSHGHDLGGAVDDCSGWNVPAGCIDLETPMYEMVVFSEAELGSLLL